MPFFRVLCLFSTIASIAFLNVSIKAFAKDKEATLQASYVATLAGLRIGSGYLSVALKEGAYAASVEFKTDSVAKLVSDGQGKASAQGYLNPYRALPENFELTSKEGKKDNVVSIKMERGDVLFHKAEPPLESHPHRVAVKAEHRKGIVDPLSALIMPVSRIEAVEGPEACNRILTLFDGRQRYDIALKYVRNERIDTDKYQGIVMVCQANYTPIAGHRDNKKLNKELSKNQDLFVWLAPIGTTGVVVPWRLEVGLRFGRLAIQSKGFQVGGQSNVIMTKAAQ